MAENMEGQNIGRCPRRGHVNDAGGSPRQNAGKGPEQGDSLPRPKSAAPSRAKLLKIDSLPFSLVAKSSLRGPICCWCTNARDNASF